jgi:energy-coupling factor transporter ATP-binding protein EcfA2
MSLKEKTHKVNEVIETLDLKSCQHTIIGSPLNRGLSGGEKKRTNIACEMLTDPFILLLDEPTSGLDSSTAYSLFMNLKKLAHSEGKTIVTSIHQPSSQLFYSFDKLLLIAKGKVAYYGPAKSVMDYFSSVGLNCTLLYNPADYILEMVSAPESRELLIGPDPPETNLPQQRKWWQKIWPMSTCYEFYHHRRHAKALPPPATANHTSDSVVVAVDDGSDTTKEPAVAVDTLKGDSVAVIMEYQEEPKEFLVSTNHTLQTAAVDSKISKFTTDEGISSSSSLAEEGEEVSSQKKRVNFDINTISRKASKGVLVGGRKSTVTAYVEEAQMVADESVTEKKWINPWYMQFLVLCHRTFKQSRSTLLSPLNILQTILLSIVCCVVWFQIPYLESTVQDRYGLFFFTTIYWSFQGCFLAVTTFPSERLVVSKERAAGSYHLSAYYLAKTLSEIPLILFLPSIFVVLVLPISGIQGAGSFFGAWLTILLGCFSLQSLGLLLGAILSGPKALTMCIVLMLTLMLVGGFYVQALPIWISWFKFISPITYAYRAVLQFVFRPDITFVCQTPSEYAVCAVNSTDLGANITRTLTGPDVLLSLDVTTHLALNLCMLVVIAIFLRFLAYLALRFFHRQRSPQ